jgi:hypothetical protein
MDELKDRDPYRCAQGMTLPTTKLSALPVLLIEDEPCVAEFVRTALEHRWYCIAVFTSRWPIVRMTAARFPVLFKNPSSVIVTPTIESKIFRQPCFSRGFPKSLRHGSEVSRHGTLGRKNSAFPPRATTCPENAKSTITHRYTFLVFLGLAVGHEDDTVLLVQVLNAHWVRFSLIPHADVTH